MNCEQVRSLLPDHLNGFTHRDTDTEIESHLEHCADCSRTLVERVDGYAGEDGSLEITGMLRQADPCRTAPTSESPVRRLKTFRVLALLAATIVAVLFLIRPDDVSGRNMVLEQMRQGPVDVTAAVYRVKGGSSSREPMTREVVYQQGGLQRETTTSRGRVVSAYGTDGRLRWSFDATKDLVELTDEVEPSDWPHFLDGAELVDYLMENFDLEYGGQVDVGGHRCWLLEGKGQASEEEVSLYIDAVSRLLRKKLRRSGDGEIEETVLAELASSLPRRQFTPGPLITAATIVDVQVGVFPVTNQPLPSFLESIIERFGAEGVVVARGKDGEELNALLELVEMLRLDLDQGRLTGGGFIDVQVIGGEMSSVIVEDSDGKGPPSFVMKIIDREKLSQADSFQAMIELIEAECGVTVEVRTQNEDLQPARFELPFPEPIIMVLDRLASANDLAVRVKGDRIIFTDRD